MRARTDKNVNDLKIRLVHLVCRANHKARSVNTEVCLTCLTGRRKQRRTRRCYQSLDSQVSRRGNRGRSGKRSKRDTGAESTHEAWRTAQVFLSRCQLLVAQRRHKTHDRHLAPSSETDKHVTNTTA